MSKPGFQLTGVAQMVSRINQVVKTKPDLAMKALHREAQIEMTESKRRVPVKTGVLKASGTVHEPERRGAQISVTLSYGGAAESYAIIVHEDPDAAHRIGQWKYLESVLQESSAFMLSRLAARLKL